MSILQTYGMPGMGPTRSTEHRAVFRGNWEWHFPGGKQIDGAKSRDPDSATPTVLRPGLLMGKIAASGYYAPTILGVFQSAYTSGGTSVTVSLAQAAEIIRRVGASGAGTLNAIGPPTAAGTVATTAVTFSAIDPATGIITVTSLGVNKVAGTIIAAADGSQTPITLIPDGWGINVADIQGNSVAVVPFPQLPIGGTVYTNRIINYSADASIQAFIKNSLSSLSGGKFTFDDAY